MAINMWYGTMQIFPVFAVITKSAAILTGSKYHLAESTWNLAC